MRVYLDTGVFIDYLSARTTSALRTSGRRGRALADIPTDAEQLLRVLAQKHQAATSCLTYYEVEEALFKLLAIAAKGNPNAQKLLVPAARSLMIQTQMVVRSFRISVLDLTSGIIETQLKTVELEGIRAADALHIATALEFRAELIVSTDDGVLGLHEMLSTNSGKVKCLDTNDALRLL